MITGLMQTGFTYLAAAVAAIPIHPTSASSIADSVDHLYYFLTAITLFFTFGIFTTIFYFMVKFRRRSPSSCWQARPASSRTRW
jgi:heme/copper-type cytochrome/quinol oxidase subunit 2